MTTNKAWGAGIASAIGAALVTGVETYTGHALDPYIKGLVVGAFTWLGTYFSPANKPA